LHDAARHSVESCLKDTVNILSCIAKNLQKQAKIEKLHQNVLKWCIPKHQ
jgi:hypothetical protein